PAGTPVTLASLANLAMSISDNTATDALIALTGRDAVEAVSPRNTPFLTTREMFTLKSENNADLRRRWSAADAASRQRLLPEIAGLPLPDPGELSSVPTIDIEWFMSAAELCALLDDTAALPALRINPGLARPSDWTEIAYKGGSEPGVLSFATRLAGEDGAAHCVVATWNDDAALDDAQLAAP